MRDGTPATGGAGTTEGGASATGGRAATGGDPIQPFGGTPANSTGGSHGTSTDDCLCPSGGAPYSVLVRGDGADAILTINLEAPASASLACPDWLTGLLRGAITRGCGSRFITFAACAAVGDSAPCLAVDNNRVTYIDAAGETWTGTAGAIMSTTPSVNGPMHQEGSFTVDVTREDVTRSLSVFYVLCDSRNTGGFPPC